MGKKKSGKKSRQTPETSTSLSIITCIIRILQNGYFSLWNNLQQSCKVSTKTKKKFRFRNKNVNSKKKFFFLCSCRAKSAFSFSLNTKPEDIDIKNLEILVNKKISENLNILMEKENKEENEEI